MDPVIFRNAVNGALATFPKTQGPFSTVDYESVINSLKTGIAWPNWDFVDKLKPLAKIDIEAGGKDALDQREIVIDELFFQFYGVRAEA